ncbi:MAG: adenylyltransferase [Deltaproteobacteria bacterium]|nr:MAG: adenylyltransferase [Deltaproteobacteria bacterium]
MNAVSPPKPHGGRIVDLRVDAERAALLKQLAMDLPDVVLNERHMCDLELLATGAFSPLTGFMVQADHAAVCDRMRLSDGTLWPIPICLDVSEDRARRLEAGQSVALRDPEGFLLGVMHLADIWPAAVEDEARAVYGTLDRSHPGVDFLLQRAGNFYLGGPVEVISLPIHYDFKQIRRTPAEIRALHQRLGWQRVVGFTTRNPVHRPQYELTLAAMRQARANLLLLPFVGVARPEDIDHYTRVRCYQEILRHYPPDTAMLNLLPLAVRLAGPRNALLHAIIAKNFGCTHFIVGRDHGSPGLDMEGRPFYDCRETRALAADMAQELGIGILSFDEMCYLPYEDEYRFADQVPAETQTLRLTGSQIRQRLRSGRRIPEWASFPEVVAELQRAWPPPRRQGFTVFLTGLSGAGKSTIAKVLYSRFLEIGDRPVTLLDGDIVRHHLSSELTFSKEHRDVNVRRIGFVASEITKNRGIAICAPIAPYRSTRREIRRSIEAYGGFIEVHVSTPLAVCEQRDRKGMYAKARAGLIKGFTGVDDPYEAPEKPELRIDTEELTPDEAAQQVLVYLGQRGFL